MKDPDTVLAMLTQSISDSWDRLRYDGNAVARLQELLLFVAAQQAQDLKIPRELWLDVAKRQWSDALHGTAILDALLKNERPAKPK